MINLPPTINPENITLFEPVLAADQGYFHRVSEDTIRLTYRRAGNEALSIASEIVHFTIILRQEDDHLVGECHVSGVDGVTDIRGKTFEEVGLKAYEHTQTIIQQWTAEILRRNSEKLIQLARAHPATVQ